LNNRELILNSYIVYSTVPTALMPRYMDYLLRFARSFVAIYLLQTPHRAAPSPSKLPYNTASPTRTRSSLIGTMQALARFDSAHCERQTVPFRIFSVCNRVHITQIRNLRPVSWSRTQTMHCEISVPRIGNLQYVRPKQSPTSRAVCKINDVS
jgi:hypothetical protein